MLSIVRLDGDIDDADDVADIDGSFDATEENPVGIALGVALLLPGQNGVRIETRYFDQFSVSVAGAVAF